MSNTITLNVWGRNFDLDVTFEKYRGENILPNQEEALKKFTSSGDIAFDDAKSAVENYCLEWNKEDIGANNIDNIFKYVKPKSLYIPRSTEIRLVVIMCAYKFYSDNRIAVVFKNEKFDKVAIDDEVI